MHKTPIIDGKRLTIKHVFFGDERPVFFVVENEDEELFVCSFFDDRNGLNWIVCPTSLQELSNMMHDRITIRDLFDASVEFGKSYLVRWENGVYDVKKIPYKQIDVDDLPTPGYYFEASKEDIELYLRAFNLDVDYTHNTFLKDQIQRRKKEAYDEHLRKRWLQFLVKQHDVRNRRRGIIG
ncbi:hypothetical protein NZ47_09300 [Anaerovibrio lipolyticus]|uniref:Uncharacterized protein n=1 Tax=Anaerovibrio lipolyticus TaxID=82374 RepID=A0A0B2JTJ4_9FIRM|nr:hypothetical protein [Anaerovibrio lipolyticus]KHM51655.1 hypothetical protein NZ47_09300 [Anaerovibrio lipolyticus]